MTRQMNAGVSSIFEWTPLRSIPIGAAMLAAALTFAHTAEAQTASLCGPAVHHSTKRVKTRSELEATPPADKALVYVVRPTIAGGFVQTKLSMDRKWVGVNQRNTYFVIAVDPGTHDFCSESENGSRLTLTIQAGKIYYLQQHIRMGTFKAQNELSQINEEEGQAALGKCDRMVSWEKGQPEPREK
jgi:hypothetical protein